MACAIFFLVFLSVFRLQLCCILLFRLNHSLLFRVTLLSMKVYCYYCFPWELRSKKSSKKETLNDDIDDDQHNGNEELLEDGTSLPVINIKF